MTAEGDDLGPLRTSTLEWREGDRIQRGNAEELVVVRLVTAEPGDDVDGYLVVVAAPAVG
jgi:hypothetical protein